MRIAILSWESLHSIAVGGVGAHVTELGAALERKGHEVHIFTRKAPGQRYHDWIDGVHYHRCPYPPHAEFVEDVNNMCRAFVERFFAIEDYVGHFDIVHAHDWLAANAMIWIRQGRGHQCILTMHSTEYGRCGNCFPGGRSHRIRSQERAGTYWANRVIAVSYATKREITWMYEVPDWKVTVVYNGVGPHRFDGPVDAGEIKQRYGIGPLEPTVLFCGRLALQKGPDLLIEAVPAILKYYRQAKFVFAGDGEMRGSLENRARQLGIAHAVRFLGQRNGQELISLFKAVDAVCVPSRNEPFGIVVLEAWASRKPVVVTVNGGPNEYVRHEENGLKVHPSPDSLAWGLGTLFTDFDRARLMGENGRQTVEARFTWDAIAEETLAVYHQVCPAACAGPPPADTSPAAALQATSEPPAAPRGDAGQPGPEQPETPTVFPLAPLPSRSELWLKVVHDAVALARQAEAGDDGHTGKESRPRKVGAKPDNGEATTPGQIVGDEADVNDKPKEATVHRRGRKPRICITAG
jgi:glycogen synthase